MSRHGFDDWRRRGAAPPRATDLAEGDLVAEIRRIHARSGSINGSPTVTAALVREGRCVNHKRVERLIRLRRIAGTHERRRRRSRCCATGAGLAPEDPVRGDFAPHGPDTVWAGDITFIPTARDQAS